MKTIGIIAEYNPFHNGHLYQIQEIKKQTGAQNIVVVMSGNFVQRGAPAWTDKYLRTRMALACGVDFVFELPVCFSTASASLFARAGVCLLTALGFVDGICFGSECGDLSALRKIAQFLNHPPASFDLLIKEQTAQGVSYPAARENALVRFFPAGSLTEATIKKILGTPNNILAIEYLKALQMLDSPLTPFTIRRNGNGYHCDALTNGYSSAAAIRQESLQADGFLHRISGSVPLPVRSLLQKHPKDYPVTEDDFSQLLFYRLCHLTGQDAAISDITPELLDRIAKLLPNYQAFSDFVSALKTKQYTYCRISRVLLHILLGITDTMTKLPDSCPDCFPYMTPYARLLGFQKEKSSLLRQVRHIPVLTKPADGIRNIRAFYTDALYSVNASDKKHPPADSKKLSEILHYAETLYQKDLFSGNLYNQVQAGLSGRKPIPELTRGPIIPPSQSEEA
ncbi:MAG: nucleotidyltransferase family protein [Clostridiaceae bacterium]|nr:nucleotidyltransferase family protein [Clostridiaceae bacterium]